MNSSCFRTTSNFCCNLSILRLPILIFPSPLLSRRLILLSNQTYRMQRSSSSVRGSWISLKTCPMILIFCKNIKKRT
ncbi:hypothetical protein ANCCAN_13343 [Ancylostoma caninum]|uniref:Uncharacterized protein n=1 Tax=Ancylostoma caninum TaxID=29170 RepID=A0A368GCF2_ANCCA|nr:hypothetical protein ANCCAN_13343 [Ancylostoma caninum]